MTDQKAAAMQHATTHAKRAQAHATLYVGDQIARLADAIERQKAPPAKQRPKVADEDPLAGMLAGARAFFKAVTS